MMLHIHCLGIIGFAYADLPFLGCLCFVNKDLEYMVLILFYRVLLAGLNAIVTFVSERK